MTTSKKSAKKPALFKIRAAGVVPSKPRPVALQEAPREEPPVVRRNSWKSVSPLPRKRVTLVFGRDLAAAELKRLARGFVPREMGDKWFVFLERNRLYCHRSWTGNCIYVAHLETTGAGAKISKVEVANDGGTYSVEEPAKEAKKFRSLVDGVLLRPPLGSKVKPSLWRWWTKSRSLAEPKERGVMWQFANKKPVVRTD